MCRHDVKNSSCAAHRWSSSLDIAALRWPTHRQDEGEGQQRALPSRQLGRAARRAARRLHSAKSQLVLHLDALSGSSGDSAAHRVIRRHMPRLVKFRAAFLGQ